MNESSVESTLKFLWVRASFILKWLSDPPLNEIQQHDTRMIFLCGYDGEWARELGRLARKKTAKNVFIFILPENIGDARSYDIHDEAGEPQFCARAPEAEKSSQFEVYGQQHHLIHNFTAHSSLCEQYLNWDRVDK